MTERNGWVEQSFARRECCRYVPSPSDISHCFCGRSLSYHKQNNIDVASKPGEVWRLLSHTQCYPTDAYGTIDFLGGAHPNKARYVRLSVDSKMDSIHKLLTRDWSLEIPKLIISVHGGKANFELTPQLKDALAKGLLKTVKSVGIGGWIITNGISTGAARHVGDALFSERAPRLRDSRVVSIGITPWGMVENRHSLTNGNTIVPYVSMGEPQSGYEALNSRHACFLLVDNGTVGRYGAESVLRRKLEKHLAAQSLPTKVYCTVPTVCLVLGGGIDVIRTVLEYVTDCPPVPVIVFAGSGRAADLLAFAYEHSDPNGETTERAHDCLIRLITTAFDVDKARAQKVHQEIMLCMKKKNLITVFEGTENSCCNQAGSSVELDHLILSAACSSRSSSPSEQLGLSLIWNRVDIARSNVFLSGRDWNDGILEEAMMDSLLNDRVEFVKILLENGVQMGTFLTIPRLEELYNSSKDPANILCRLVREVRPGISKEHFYTLLDIGLVCNMLMGGAFRSGYTRRQFRVIYRTTRERNPFNGKNNSANKRFSNTSQRRDNYKIQSLDNLAVFPRSESYETTSYNKLAQLRRSLTSPSLTYGQRSRDSCVPGVRDNYCGLQVSACIFQHPFNELMIWAVLTQRQSMALLMWKHGHEALIKALVACKLYRVMAQKAADDDTEVDIYEQMGKYASEFEQIALELLDYCHSKNENLSQQLLVCAQPNWSRQNCMGVAFSCGHRSLLAHPSSQKILADMWLGGLRIRRNQSLKVLVTLIFPPLILNMSFKSRNQLQLMPKIEGKNLYYLEEEAFGDGVSPRDSVADEPSIRTASGNRSASSVRFAEPFGADTKENTSFKSPSTQQIAESYRSPKQLKVARKITEFYEAPITKFWIHALGYLAFIVIYAYLNLVKLDENVLWQEWYVMVTVGTFGLEAIREIVGSEPVKLGQKIKQWIGFWHVMDIVAILEFYSGLAIRLQTGLKNHGRVFYLINLVYWVVRALRFLFPFRELGPLVTMMATMIRKMLYFCIILFVFLTSYGIFRQSLLFPYEEPSWVLGRNVFYKTHMMIYGEEFTEEFDVNCKYIARYPNGTIIPGNDTGMAQKVDGDPLPEGEYECVPGRWLDPLFQAGYLLMTYLLLINMIIAMFNAIYFSHEPNAHELWLFNRFEIVTQYNEKPLLPPPFIALSHLYRILKWFRRRNVQKLHDVSLKLFLDQEALERLLDFEAECMDTMKCQKETKEKESVDEKLREVNEKLDQAIKRGPRCRKCDCQRDWFSTHQAEVWPFLHETTEDHSPTVSDCIQTTSILSESNGSDFIRQVSTTSVNKNSKLSSSARVAVPRKLEEDELHQPGIQRPLELNLQTGPRSKSESETLAISAHTLPSCSRTDALALVEIINERKRTSSSDSVFLTEADELHYDTLEDLVGHHLHSDSPNLDESFEELCNTSLKDVSLCETPGSTESVAGKNVKIAVSSNSQEADEQCQGTVEEP